MRSFFTTILTLIISTAMVTDLAGFNAPGPKAPGTVALSRASVIEPGLERDLEGIGFLRALPGIAADSVGPFETSLEDGTRFLVLRISTGNAPAARLYIRNMALGKGAKLFLYGIDSTGSLTTVHGPYENVGPLQSGEFWTDAISGAEIVVELQAGEDLPADIPFEVAGLASANPSEAIPSVERRIDEVRTSMYKGVPLTHAVEDGIAIFEGDIELGPADELQPASPGFSKKAHRESVAITGQNYRWPNGIIPYIIDPAIPNPTRVTSAIAHWNTVMAGYIQFIPRTTQTAHVYFVRSTTASKCSSTVGKMLYGQLVQVGDSCALGNLIHESGHAVGLWHEQGREDRNTYVKVNFENMQAGTSNNFTQNISNGDDLGAYDYGSIMHYPATGFSVNGLPTIETIPPGIPIGQRSALSAGDIAAVKALYPAPAPTPPPATQAITLASIPSGRTITADGVNYTTPKTLQWTPGSVHTITATNPVVVNGVRNLFVRWTDAGAQTHTVVAPASAATYRADYATSYNVTATATAGSVVITTEREDAFYPQNSSITLQAIAPAGSCFTSWTGLVAGTPATTKLSLPKSYALQANFATGSVTAPAAVTVPKTASTQSLSVSATAGCHWTAASPVSWITITAGKSGTGPGVVKLSVAASTVSRTATLTIAGKSVVVTQ